MASNALQIDFLLSGSNLNNGNPNDAGQVFFFAVGGTTNKAVYSDNSQTAYTMNTISDASHPLDGKEYVLLNSGGKPGNGEVYGDGAYRIDVYTSAGVLVETHEGTNYQVPATSAISAEAKTSSFTADSGVQTYYVTGTTTATIFLASSVDDGHRITIINLDSSLTTTVARSGSDTFNGATSIALDIQYASVTLESLNDNWNVVQLGIHDHSSVTKGGSTLNSPTIVTPTIADLTNMTHDHSDAAGGGPLFVGPGFQNIKSNFDDLIVKQASTTTIDIDADSAIVYTSAGVSHKIGTVNLTITLDNTGANGRDTAEGGVAVDWYHLWVMVKSSDNTIAGFATKAITFPSDMPTDYDLVAYAGACRVSSTGPTVIVSFHQISDRVRSSTGNFTEDDTTTTATNDISALVPDTTKLAYFNVTHATDGVDIFLHPAAVSVSAANCWAVVEIGPGGAGEQMNCPIETTQTIFGAVSGGTATVYVVGWEY